MVRGTTSTAPAAASASFDPLDAADAATVAMRRARAAQLERVHQAVESGRWHIHGFRSPHAWLTTTSGEAPGACSLTLQLAERIQHMPIVKDRFTRGVLAESALRLLADTWHPDLADVFARDEQMLVGWASNLAHRDFKMVLSTWRLHADPDGADRSEQDRFDSRKLHLSELLDGMGRLDGLLDPEGMKLVAEAIRVLAVRTDGDERTSEQRRADALVSMAKQVLTNLQPTPGTKRNRPKLIATIAVDDLIAATRGGVLDTNTGPVTLSAEAIRRLACDAGIHRLITGPDGVVVDYGRQTRSVSDAQFDLLTIRDHGCRIPGCPIPPGGCDAHHSIHWANDGNTDLDDLVLLCWYHHHLLHEQHWSLEPLGAGHFVLRDSDGNIRPLRPPIVGLALPQLALDHDARHRAS
jgi:hypothetical protein